ncbi:hypothetical protein [Amycolatopsis aidingensis]|uniref:hypothetical protein n=1 Tax=Amycolatopsis aidingensis TaxID=2842453 RepID=UPI001C0C126B|nr:hypothetical protein [Amycolatopsis aidingensis]
MNQLERRYRRVLRLLPAFYRREWEEDMVATFLLTAQPSDLEEAEFAADYGRPSWPEVASVLALAVRLRLGGAGAPPRYLTWGETVRRVALVGLLAHAVMALVGAGGLLWSWTRSPGLFGIDSVAWQLAALLWVPAYLALVAGRRRAARILAGLALVPGLVSTGSVVTDAGSVYLASALGVLSLDVLPVLALAAFHRNAPPVKPRPWLVALPAGAVLVVAAYLLAQSFGLLVDQPAILCAAVFFAATGYLAVSALASRPRTASWPATLALLAVAVLGVRVLTLLDYLRFSVNVEWPDALVIACVVEAAAVSAVTVPLGVVAVRVLRDLPASGRPLQRTPDT